MMTEPPAGPNNTTPGVFIVISACILLSAGEGLQAQQGGPGSRAQGHRPNPMTHYGPWNRDLSLFESSDGRIFHRQGLFVERGGVPALAKARDGRLLAVFQWFPFDNPEAFDRIAIRVSTDHGRSWDAPRSIGLRGLPETLRRAFDPALVVLEDGSFRLYFASDRGNAYGTHGNRAIFSARSPDGLTYTVEPGERFGFEDRETYDPTVAKLGGTWHLYCPQPGPPGRGYHATSRDGLHFSAEEDVVIPGHRQWLGAVVAVAEELWFYGSGEGGWMARSRDGFTWTLEPAVHYLGADPGVVGTDDGRTLLVATGELRDDAEPGPPPEGVFPAGRK